MDPLSAISAAAAIAQILGQVAFSVKRMHDFWVAIESAPEDVREITRDLQTLHGIIEHIKLIAITPCDTSKPLEDAITLCKENIEKLELDIKPLITALARLHSNVMLFAQTTRAITLENMIKSGVIALKNINQGHCKPTKDPLVISQSTGDGKPAPKSQKRLLEERTTETVAFSAFDLGITALPPLSTRSQVQAKYLRGAECIRPMSGIISKQTDTYIGILEKDSSIFTHEGDHVGRPTQLRKDSSKQISSLSSKSWVYTQSTKIYSRKTFLGNITTYKTTKSEAVCGDIEAAVIGRKTREAVELQVHLAGWLSVLIAMLGLCRQLSISYASRSMMKTTRISIKATIRGDSIVWDLIRQGNLQALRSMFERGDATPLDCTLTGKTLLHVAAEYCQWDLCRYLYRQGANIYEICQDSASPNCTAIDSALEAIQFQHAQTRREKQGYSAKGQGQILDLRNTPRGPPPPEIMKVLRLFLDEFGYDPNHGQWSLYDQVAWCHPEAREPLNWLLRRTDFTCDLLDTSGSIFLQGIRFDLEFHKTGMQTIPPHLLAFSPASTRPTLHDCHPLLRAINELQDHMSLGRAWVRGLLNNGVNIHSGWASSTPCMAAARTSRSFYEFRGILKDLGFDLNEVVDEDWRQCRGRWAIFRPKPPVLAGYDQCAENNGQTVWPSLLDEKLCWPKSAVKELFALDFTPVDPPAVVRNAGYDYWWYQDPWWEAVTERIRQGESVTGLVDGDRTTVRIEPSTFPLNANDDPNINDASHLKNFIEITPFDNELQVCCGRFAPLLSSDQVDTHNVNDHVASMWLNEFITWSDSIESRCERVFLKYASSDPFTDPEMPVADGRKERILHKKRRGMRVSSRRTLGKRKREARWHPLRFFRIKNQLS